jgi:hypothetical protein
MKEVIINLNDVRITIDEDIKYYHSQQWNNKYFWNSGQRKSSWK